MRKSFLFLLWQQSDLRLVVYDSSPGYTSASMYHLLFSQQLFMPSAFVVLMAGLDKDCRLTEPLGMRIAEFPLNPMFAKMLLESGRWRPVVLIDFILSRKLFLKFCVPWGRRHNVACVRIFFFKHWRSFHLKLPVLGHVVSLWFKVSHH